MEMYSLFQIIQLMLRLLVYTIIGKGLLARLAGSQYQDNFIWRFFDTITRPIWRLTRAITPGFVADAAISFLAVLLLIALNLGLYMLFYSQGWITPPRASPAG